MKKNLLLLIFSVLFISGLFAQISVNPTSDFYTDATGWYLKGYVESLPQLKPYSTEVIEQILLSVIESESASEAEKQTANIYYTRYFSRKIHITAEGNFSSHFYLKENTDDNSAEYQDNYELYSAKVSIGGDVKVSPYFGFGYDFGLRGINNNEFISDQLALYENKPDFQKIDDFSLKEGNVDFLMDLNGIVTVGTKKIYGSAGFNRIGYGLFPDSDIMLNPNSYQMANANVNFDTGFFEYTQLTGVPVAQSQTVENKFSWGKVFSFHSLRVPLFKRKLLLSYYESCVYGEGFNPAYLLPVPWIIVGPVSGFTENVYAGFNVQYKPAKCIALSTDFMIHKLDAKNFIKLKWNDASVRGALKAGIVYTPLDSIFRVIKIDYTIVTPYTYTSYDLGDKTYNYSDYTNYGKCIGSELLPNSHQLAMSLQFTPVKRLSITSTAKFFQHANEYENLEDNEVLTLSGKTATDGSLKQNTQKFDTCEDETGLLNQSHKLTMVQSEIDLDFECASRKYVSVVLTAGYMFEYILNKGVDYPIFPGTYTTAAEVAMARKRWEANLHNSFNHYFKAGVKISF
ncbi:MAG: hypothetical protein II098_10680 [Treponema sp.]|nr:hypothetical protein [Treponema sp.]